MLRLFFILSILFCALTSNAQSYYWQSAGKKSRLKYLTVGGGIGGRMYFGDVQPTGQIFNKVKMAYQVDLRYQQTRHIGYSIQMGGRKYKGYKAFAYPGSYQEMNGGVWESQIMFQYNWLKWEDLSIHKFAGYDPVVNINSYIGIGAGGALFSSSFESNYTSSSDSLLTVNIENNASGFGFYVPVEFGIRYRLNPSISLNIEFQYQIYFTDKLDAVERSLNDRMGLVILKLGYSFKPPKKRL